jgi:hypothetical protein
VLNAQEKSRLKILQAKLAAATSSGSAVDLTEDDERFLDLVALKSEKQNIRKKALGGGTLTGAQRARLSSELDDGAAGLTFVQNWNELADAIPLDRRTLQNFRDEHADLIKENKAALSGATVASVFPSGVSSSATAASEAAVQTTPTLTR